MQLILITFQLLKRHYISLSPTNNKCSEGLHDLKRVLSDNTGSANNLSPPLSYTRNLSEENTSPTTPPGQASNQRYMIVLKSYYYYYYYC